MLDNVYGVLQGGVISPSLFKLYIDDMCQYLSGETGVTIGESPPFRRRPRPDVKNSIGLQRLIYRLDTYCHRWNMRLNILETKIMIFNENTEVSRDVNMFTFEAKHIQQGDSYELLILMNWYTRFGLCSYTWLSTPRHYKLVTITIKSCATNYMYTRIFWYHRLNNAFSLIDTEHICSTKH